MPNRIADILQDSLSTGNVGWVMHLNSVLQTQFPNCVQVMPVHWFDPCTARMPMFWTRSWSRDNFVDTCENLWGSLLRVMINNEPHRVMCTVPDSYDRVWIMGIAETAYTNLFVNYTHEARYLTTLSPGSLTIWLGERITRALANPNFVWRVMGDDFQHVRHMEESFWVRTMDESVYEFVQSECTLQKTKAIQALAKDLADNYVYDIDARNLYKLVSDEDNTYTEI